MTEAREQRASFRARHGRISHPLHERLIPDLEGAPPAVCEAQEAAEQMVKARRERVAKYREAEAAAQAAPAHDDAAAKAALAEGKAPPKPTAAAADARLTEARRLYGAATDGEAEALDRLARTAAEHAAEWEAKRAETLRAKSAAASEQLEQALAAWRELDREYTQVNWLHQLDPSAPKTLSVTKAAGLRDEDLDPEMALRRLLGLAERAVDRARSGEPGFQRHAERVERRRQLTAERTEAREAA
jgi:hypothetical protein